MKLSITRKRGIHKTTKHKRSSDRVGSRNPETQLLERVSTSSKKQKMEHAKDGAPAVFDTPPPTPEKESPTSVQPSMNMAKLWSMAAARKKSISPSLSTFTVAPAVPTSGRQTMLPPDPRYRGIQMNGLLDETQIPESMKEVVERNAKKSALLRIPSEVRAMIWAYVFDHQDVEISRSHTGRIGMSGWAIERKPCGLGVMTKHIPSAFHLPEVCRQIYSEIAVFGYSRSTFIIHECGPDFGLRLTQAARNEITSIELSTEDAVSLQTCPAWYQFLLDKTKLFPNLKRLGIPLCGMRERTVRRYPITDDIYRSEFRATAEYSSPRAHHERLGQQLRLRGVWKELGKECGIKIFFTFFEGGEPMLEPELDSDGDGGDDDGDDDGEEGNEEHDHHHAIIPLGGYQTTTAAAATRT
ncbi:hypothetical protein P154DRAFT_575293 [Amniculicola lignicola CBS 123094]|uniref:DUF7730 domain-containing protein n=1 Tax=Amniculicola lignicola CBS 123094 TaxID=1392246 RepID=A0A6A5WUE9_9PLEO|nr:hypothetical protein P154DRAFT_575293 [Amniculicola lignicola CBS 123094]